MILPLQFLASIVSLGMVFFYPAYSHIPLIAIAAILILFRIGMRDYDAQPPSDLSMAARQLFNTYPQFYAHTYMGSQCSGAASGLMMTMVPVTIIACVRGFWWSILITAVLMVIVAPLQRFFNPTNFFTTDSERLAHEELIEALSNQPLHVGVSRQPSNPPKGDRMFTVNLPGGTSSGWVYRGRVMQWLKEGRIDGTSWVYPSDTREWVRVGDLFKLPSGERPARAKPLGAAVRNPKRLNPRPTTTRRRISSELKTLEDFELMDELKSRKLGPGAQEEIVQELASRGIKVA